MLLPPLVIYPTGMSWVRAHHYGISQHFNILNINSNNIHIPLVGNIQPISKNRKDMLRYIHLSVIGQEEVGQIKIKGTFNNYRRQLTQRDRWHILHFPRTGDRYRGKVGDSSSVTQSGWFLRCQPEWVIPQVSARYQPDAYQMLLKSFSSLMQMLFRFYSVLLMCYPAIIQISTRCQSDVIQLLLMS